MLKGFGAADSVFPATKKTICKLHCKYLGPAWQQTEKHANIFLQIFGNSISIYYRHLLATNKREAGKDFLFLHILCILASPGNTQTQANKMWHK